MQLFEIFEAKIPHDGNTQGRYCQQAPQSSCHSVCCSPRHSSDEPQADLGQSTRSFWKEVFLYMKLREGRFEFRRVMHTHTCYYKLSLSSQRVKQCRSQYTRSFCILIFSNIENTGNVKCY